MCLVGLGVCENAVFKISNCFAFIVVRGPRRFDPELPSSGLLFSVWESRVSGSPSREFWSSESSAACPDFESVPMEPAISPWLRLLLFVSPGVPTGRPEGPWTPLWCFRTVPVELPSSSSSSSLPDPSKESGIL